MRLGLDLRHQASDPGSVLLWVRVGLEVRKGTLGQAGEGQKRLVPPGGHPVHNSQAEAQHVLPGPRCRTKAESRLGLLEPSIG